MTAVVTVGTDIIDNITVSPMRQAVIISRCLMLHWPIVFSISQFVDADNIANTLGEIKEKLSKLLIKLKFVESGIKAHPLYRYYNHMSSFISLTRHNIAEKLLSWR